MAEAYAWVTRVTVISASDRVSDLLWQVWKAVFGETKGPLNIRMNGHRDDWRHKRFERSPTA